MATDLRAEQEAQKVWQLRAGREAAAVTFDQLIENEFADPDVQNTEVDQAIATIVRYAGRNIPYYADLFAQKGILAPHIRNRMELRRIPAMSRLMLQREYARLKPNALPVGDEPGGQTASSGTTGERIVVDHTNRNRRIFTVLKQREYRWFRYDPSGSQLWIRRRTSIPPHPDGRRVAPGEVMEFPEWPGLGRIFETGSCFAASHDNNADWLADQALRIEPNSLMATNARMEHLVFALRDRTPPANMAVGQAVTGIITPEARAQIEAGLGIRLYQNYGLNEVGIVASQCEERNYHIHREHCWAEVVDDDGEPVEPGQIGRILVTALGNTAMPLIRYDTGDLAQAGPETCPCGRTLPTIGRILGRRSRIECLPEGTYELATRMLAEMAKLPAKLARPLREYQLHQFANGGFEMRLVLAGKEEPSFADHLAMTWLKLTSNRAIALDIRKVDRLAMSHSGKFMHFTSEHISPDDGILPQA